MSTQHTADVDDVPTDELSADREVADLEARIAAGDDTVGVEDLQRAREAAAGRKRFAALRGVFAEREARRAAAQREREQAAAAQEHARAVLAPYTPAALVPLYDAAVEALRAYTAALAARNDVVVELGRLPRAERHRAVVATAADPAATRVDLDGHSYRVQRIDQHVRRVLGAAGVASHSLDVVDRAQFALDDDDPAIVAEGRAQLAARRGRRSAS